MTLSSIINHYYDDKDNKCVNEYFSFLVIYFNGTEMTFTKLIEIDLNMNLILMGVLVTLFLECIFRRG